MKAIAIATVALALTGAWLMFGMNEPELTSFESSSDHDLFMAWMSEFGKSYDNQAEYQTRFTLFQKTLRSLEKHATRNDRKYEMGLNHFADLTDEEFQGMLGFIPAEVRTNEVRLTKNIREPSHVDWTEAGCVQHVKDQKSCGSCYSFSATGAIESAHCARTGEMLDLADKDCLDCSFRYGNKGCMGGHMINCFQYFMEDKYDEICYETAYPYNGKYNVCAEKNCAQDASFHHPVTGFHSVPSGDITAFMAALDSQPLACAIEADHEIFRNYKGGILHDDPKQYEDEEQGVCGTGLNHGILVTGYEFNGDLNDHLNNYIIIKNSWSTKWGDNGYVKVAFGEIKKGGTCGFLLDCSFPLTS